MNKNEIDLGIAVAKVFGVRSNIVDTNSKFYQVCVHGTPVVINGNICWNSERGAQMAATNVITHFVHYGDDTAGGCYDINNCKVVNDAYKMMLEFTGISLKWEDYAIEPEGKKNPFDNQYLRHQKALNKVKGIIRDILLKHKVVTIEEI